MALSSFVMSKQTEFVFLYLMILIFLSICMSRLGILIEAKSRIFFIHFADRRLKGLNVWLQASFLTSNLTFWLFVVFTVTSLTIRFSSLKVLWSKRRDRRSRDGTGESMSTSSTISMAMNITSMELEHYWAHKARVILVIENLKTAWDFSSLQSLFCLNLWCLRKFFKLSLSWS